ncbi:hypothetical protein AO354_46905, partial [Pseudomonas syringae pv. syringae]
MGTSMTTASKARKALGVPETENRALLPTAIGSSSDSELRAIGFDSRQMLLELRVVGQELEHL